MPAICPTCGDPLAADRLEGLCPRCLLRSVPTGGEDPGSTKAAESLPSLARLAPLFPQLEILELLGQGGMGAVYKARQIKLDRLVALKILPPAYGADPSFAERFIREARALARLSHPNIVTVHDFGESDGLYYLIMEYVDGVNLRKGLADGQLTAQRALSLVRDLCDALQYAHDSGVVHRDIKPENILLDRQGRIKVADFGLAKLVGSNRSSERLTATGQSMGTPHYMAPEQWEQAGSVDHRADIYSLGVVFYELLTGELPMGNFPRASEKAKVDVRVDGVVSRALEREPERRYQRMVEMKSAVEQVGAEGPQPKAPAILTPTPTSKPIWQTALEIAGTVVTAGGLLLGLRFAAMLPETFDVSVWRKGMWLALTVVILILAFDARRFGQWLASVVGLTLLAGVAGWCYQNRTLPETVEAIGGLVLVYWFGTCLAGVLFPEQGGGGGLQAAGSRPAFLSERLVELPEEHRLRQDLLLFQPLLAYRLQVVPEVEPETLSEARKFCEVPPEERVVGVLPFDMDSEMQASSGGMVFGMDGVYYRNGTATEQPGVGRLRYKEMLDRSFVDHGKAVYLGKDQYIYPRPDESEVETSALTDLLLVLRLKEKEAGENRGMVGAL